MGGGQGISEDDVCDSKDFLSAEIFIPRFDFGWHFSPTTLSTFLNTADNLNIHSDPSIKSDLG